MVPPTRLKRLQGLSTARRKARTKARRQHTSKVKAFLKKEFSK